MAARFARNVRTPDAIRAGASRDTAKSQADSGNNRHTSTHNTGFIARRRALPRTHTPGPSARWQSKSRKRARQDRTPAISSASTHSHLVRKYPAATPINIPHPTMTFAQSFTAPGTTLPIDDRSLTVHPFRFLRSHSISGNSGNSNRKHSDGNTGELQQAVLLHLHQAGAGPESLQIHHTPSPQPTPTRSQRQRLQPNQPPSPSLWLGIAVALLDNPSHSPSSSGSTSNENPLIPAMASIGLTARYFWHRSQPSRCARERRFRLGATRQRLVGHPLELFVPAICHRVLLPSAPAAPPALGKSSKPP